LGSQNKTSDMDTITFDVQDGTYIYSVGVQTPDLANLFAFDLFDTGTNTSSGTGQTGVILINYSSVIPINGDFYLFGTATKQADVAECTATNPYGVVVVSGEDEDVDLQMQQTALTETTFIVLHYIYPDQTTLMRAAQTSFSLENLNGPLIYQTFDAMNSSFLNDHAGNWSVQAFATLKLSAGTFSQTLNLTSGILEFEVEYTGPTFQWGVNVAGVKNYVTLWVSENASVSEPVYVSSGRGYDLSFTMTGPTGTHGSVTMAIPTGVIPAGFHPQITINEEPYSNFTWNFSQNNYYIYLTMHFSTDNVKIIFIRDGAENAPDLIWTGIVVVVAVSAVAVVTILAFRRHTKRKGQFPPPPPPPHS
jgi:hypothetical protein